MSAEKIAAHLGWAHGFLRGALGFPRGCDGTARAVQGGVRTLALALALVASLATTAGASPFTVGVAGGWVQSASDASSSPNNDWQLWARLHVWRGLSTQLEWHKLDNDNAVAMGTVNAIAILDLMHGQWVPFVLAGVGVDYGDNTSDPGNGFDVATGIGFEYRSPGGVVVGIDARIGTRSVSQPETAFPGCNFCALQSPPDTALANGEYRAVRLAVGLHF